MKKFLGVVLVLALMVCGIVASAEEKPFIELGDYNEDVIALHNKLIDFGLLDIRAESPYGSKSAEAVKVLQRAMGAEETGKVRDRMELENLLSATLDINVNLANGTEEPVTVAPMGNNNWCEPIELFPTSELGMALLRSTKLFVLSFDWVAEGVDTAVDASISLRYTGADAARYSAVGYFDIPVGNNSGHCEITFEPIESMRENGTGWLIGNINHGNRKMRITISNFNFRIVEMDGKE